MEFRDVIQNLSGAQRRMRLQECEASREFGKYPVFFNGRQEYLEVLEIPLKLLRFNTKNGRILMDVASLNEATGERSIDVEDIESQELIYNALWDSNLERNSRTLEDLQLKGQQVPGVVTSDGVIIDGNRRASLLIKLQILNPSRNFTFKAVKLALSSDDENGKTLEAFEIEKQISEDTKVDYNPINKYIKAAKMSEDYNLPVSDLAKLWKVSESKMKEWLDIKKNMDKYLNHINARGQYKRLVDMEDGFINFTKLWKKVQHVDTPGVTDEIELNITEKLNFEKAYFDLMRYSYRNKENNFNLKNIRPLFFTAHTHGGVQFLGKPGLITRFLGAYSSVIKIENENFEQENSLTKLRELYPDKVKDELLKIKDEKWAESTSIGDVIKDIEGRNNDLNLSSRPEKTLTEIYRKFESLLMIEGETIKWRTDGIRYSLIENNDEYENTKFEAKLIGKMADFIKRNMN
jgi:hypothetical protein